jgi:pyruvate dehydrogenase (quinone)
MAQKGLKKWRSLLEERGTRQDRPIKPQVLAWELGRRLPQNAIVASDSGTVAHSGAARPDVSLSGTLA